MVVLLKFLRIFFLFPSTRQMIFLQGPRLAAADEHRKPCKAARQWAHECIFVLCFLLKRYPHHNRGSEKKNSHDIAVQGFLYWFERRHTQDDIMISPFSSSLCATPLLTASAWSSSSDASWRCTGSCSLSSSW